MKKKLRAELKLLRDSLEEKDKLSDRICEAFIGSDLYENAETLLLYYSSASEVSTVKIFCKALSDGKKTAFPLCTDNQGTMVFYYVSDEKELKKGMYGIMEPPCENEMFSGAENCICIVPGLSFDKNGYRIGYGKGYYDRFLSDFNGISVGLCYEAMVSEKVPTDKYDKKVNYLITDKKTYNFNSFKEDFKNG